jgi:hypothetical protein
MQFVQAPLPVENVEAFNNLKSLISAGLEQGTEPFLKSLRSGIQIRDFAAVAAAGLLDSGAQKAKAIYDALNVTEQAQIREFYLTKIEEIDPELRRKYKKLFRYS